jgi:CheY-like chemotaxis protein
MGQRILLFESDPAFSQEVRVSFEALGATVDVASDGAHGIELASAHKPDLILLTIELPGMNGFLVCKKIKKHDGLKDVPLLILSSEATEDVFEQHKNLRTRAEDYIHKPIAFADLLERVKQFVSIDSNGVGTAGADDEIEIDDFDDEEMILVADESTRPPVVEEPSDAELFAEEAVEALVGEDDLSAPAPAPMWSQDPSRSSAKLADVMTHEESVTAVAPAARAPRHESPRAQQDPQQAQARVARLEADLTQAERRARDAEQELQAVKQRAGTAERSLADASKKGGVSSRDFLDLREQLNRKERELLALRDQVSSRDKQLIEASEKNLGFERELADQSDRIVEQQRELEKVSEVTESLQADREGAKKRVDDLKARLDRSEQKSRELSEELSGIEAAHQKEVEALGRQHAESRASAETAQREAIEELKRQQLDVGEALRRSQHRELSELRDEHSSALTAVHETAERDKQTALTELRTALENQMQQRLAEQQQSHEALVSQALSAHENELANVRRSMAERHSTELRQTQDKYQQELGRAGRAISELETKQQLLEEQLEEAESGRADAQARLSRVTTERDQKAEQSEELQAQLNHLHAKRGSQEQMLERARKAVAIGLSLLEEQKRDAVDEQADS